MLHTYADVMNFLLRTYATDAIIAEASSDVVNFRQSPAMTKEAYTRML